MNILVCMKQVQDNAVAPKLDPATGRVVTQGVETMVSPFDLNALEAGLKLAEEHGGEVSVLAMGDEESKITLRIGLSMGAEKAYLVSDPALEDSDPWATAYTLAKAISSIGTFDVILCGKQAIDDDAGQVGAGLSLIHIYMVVILPVWAADQGGTHTGDGLGFVAALLQVRGNLLCGQRIVVVVVRRVAHHLMPCIL